VETTTLPLLHATAAITSKRGSKVPCGKMHKQSGIYGIRLLLNKTADIFLVSFENTFQVHPSSVFRYRTRLGDLKNKQSTESPGQAGEEQGKPRMTPDVAVVIPLNNPLGPADDTVTAPLWSTSTRVDQTWAAVSSLCVLIVYF